MTAPRRHPHGAPRRGGRTAGRAAAWAALVIALAGWEPFRAADRDVEAGNRAYAEGRYDDALAAYDRAARRGGVDGDGLAFDRGTAEARKAEATRDAAEKQRLTQRALDDLKQAAHARDARIRGHAHFNRGNLLMGQDKLDDAIEAYKQALREQPELDDARLNLELALRRRQKQRQQQQQGQGAQGQQGQGQQGQGQQGQGQQGQGQQGQGQQGQDPQSQGQGQGSQQQGPQGQQGQGSQGSAQSPDGQSGNASPNGQGSSQSQNGTSGNGANPQNGASGQGSNAPPSTGQGSNAPPPAQRGRPQRGRGPQSPRTPVDGKLDDLDNFSRQLQKDGARRRATGRAADPQHDW